MDKRSCKNKIQKYNAQNDVMPDTAWYKHSYILTELPVLTTELYIITDCILTKTSIYSFYFFSKSVSIKKIDSNEVTW